MSITSPDTIDPPTLSDWLKSEQGQYVAQWEKRKIAPLVSDVFGFNAIQIGLPDINFLSGNRIPLQIQLGDAEQFDTANMPFEGKIHLLCELPELPFSSNSIDLVVLSHTLEFHPHPHQLLREVERILIPEGKLVIAGFNPFSLWGIRRKLPKCHVGAPWSGQFMSLPRLKDWLKLLNLEVDRGHFGCYAPPLKSTEWIARFSWMEKAGDRWWPIASGVYLIRAVKRVPGIRLIKPKWKTVSARRRALTSAVRKMRPHD